MVGVAFHQIREDPYFFQEHPETLFGVPALGFTGVLFLIPLFLGIWIYRSGNWRRPVLTAGIVYFCSFVLMLLFDSHFYYPPEKRPIIFTVKDGIDVYCNGVHLGKTPLHLNAEQLQAKVSPWKTPPIQPMYEPGKKPLYTWLPWDDFLESRYLKSQNLFNAATYDSQTVSIGPTAVLTKAPRRNPDIDALDAQCEYWWSFEEDGNRMRVQRETSAYLNHPFQKTSRYHVNISVSTPSHGFLTQLLVDVLKDLPPERKADWDRYVLEKWSSIGNPLYTALGIARVGVAHLPEEDPDRVKWDTALDSTVRMKYGLSDPPTPEESRRVLQDWVDSSVKNNHPFTFTNPYTLGEMIPDDYCDAVYWGTEMELVGLATELMGPTLVPALREQWKKDPFRFENGWAPLVYLDGRNKETESFKNLVCYSATTRNAHISLLFNEDPRVVPLFKTLLYRKNHALFFARGTRYRNKIMLYSKVENPQTEAVFRKYVAEALSDPKLVKREKDVLTALVVSVVYDRLRRTHSDKGDLLSWVQSLPLDGESRDWLVSLFHHYKGQQLSLSDYVQQSAQGHFFTDIPALVENMSRWFEENPDHDLLDYLAAHIRPEQSKTPTLIGPYGKNILNPSDHGIIIDSNGNQYETQFIRQIIEALLEVDTPESRDLIRRIWKNQQSLVFDAIAKGRYFYFFPRDGFHFYDFQSITIPEYLLDLMEESSGEFFGYDTSPAAPLLAMCESPRAGKILEKWSESEQPLFRERSQWALKIWNGKDRIRKDRMELFEGMIQGKIRPDDLLPPETPWIWKDDRYVQADSDNP